MPVPPARACNVAQPQRERRAGDKARRFQVSALLALGRHPGLASRTDVQAEAGARRRFFRARNAANPVRFSSARRIRAIDSHALPWTPASLAMTCALRARVAQPPPHPLALPQPAARRCAAARRASCRSLGRLRCRAQAGGPGPEGKEPVTPPPEAAAPASADETTLKWGLEAGLWKARHVGLAAPRRSPRAPPASTHARSCVAADSRQRAGRSFRASPALANRAARTKAS